MKRITTVHKEIGYCNNVKIIETALRETLGFSDQSGLSTTLAEHVWSYLVIETGHYGPGEYDKVWGLETVERALQSIQCRVDKLNAHLGQMKKLP